MISRKRDRFFKLRAQSALKSSINNILQKKKYFVICYRSNDVYNFIVTYLHIPLQYNYLLLCYLIMNFKGPEVLKFDCYTCNILKRSNIFLKIHIKEHMLRMLCFTIFVGKNNVFVKWPVKGFIGAASKTSLSRL